ncbi:MAG: hypothetical protein KJI69_06115 [Patescibacteria group bacterium]|nr:hypothetical protein [Patescibacteria group bacterium]
MADSRAILKAFFETGDVPTQAQFAALIDSLLSLEDDSNLKNGIKIKSQTGGKLQIQISDTDLIITSDGDTFNDKFFSIGSLGSNLIKANLGGFVVDTSLVIDTGFNIRAPGKMKAEGLLTFANNAAALAGGLILADMYKTATGELRIVV